MPKQMRSPRTNVIDEAIAIDIQEVRTFTAFHEWWCATDSTESRERGC